MRFRETKGMLNISKIKAELAVDSEAGMCFYFFGKDQLCTWQGWWVKGRSPLWGVRNGGTICCYPTYYLQAPFLSVPQTGGRDGTLVALWSYQVTPSC